MFKEQWKIKPPPVSDRRLCFRAVPPLCISEQDNALHLGLGRQAWDKGAANSAQQCTEQVFPLPLGACSSRQAGTAKPPGPNFGSLGHPRLCCCHWVWRVANCVMTADVSGACP